MSTPVMPLTMPLPEEDFGLVLVVEPDGASSSGSSPTTAPGTKPGTRQRRRNLLSEPAILLRSAVHERHYTRKVSHASQSRSEAGGVQTVHDDTDRVALRAGGSLLVLQANPLEECAFAAL